MVQYGESKCKMLVDLNETRQWRVFGVIDYEFELKIHKFKMIEYGREIRTLNRDREFLNFEFRFVFSDPKTPRKLSSELIVGMEKSIL